MTTVCLERGAHCYRVAISKHPRGLQTKWRYHSHTAFAMRITNTISWLFSIWNVNLVLESRITFESSGLSSSKAIGRIRNIHRTFAEPCRCEYNTLVVVERMDGDGRWLMRIQLSWPWFMWQWCKWPGIDITLNAKRYTHPNPKRNGYTRHSLTFDKSFLSNCKLKARHCRVVAEGEYKTGAGRQPINVVQFKM